MYKDFITNRIRLQVFIFEFAVTVGGSEVYFSITAGAVRILFIRMKYHYFNIMLFVIIKNIVIIRKRIKISK